MAKTFDKPEFVGMSARRLERIRPAMQAYVDRGVYAGITTLIARRGKVIHEEQFGWRDKEAQSPMTADAIFRLYSMTKPIVCTGLMTLLEEGRFTLFDRGEGGTTRGSGDFLLDPRERAEAHPRAEVGLELPARR